MTTFPALTFPKVTTLEKTWANTTLMTTFSGLTAPLVEYPSFEFLTIRLPYCFGISV